MDDLSPTSILINEKNENRLKYLFARLSTVREDSQEDNHQTIINEQSDTSDFDIIESLNDLNELNEGI
jgi:hypothetical protein